MYPEETSFCFPPPISEFLTSALRSAADLMDNGPMLLQRAFHSRDYDCFCLLGAVRHVLWPEGKPSLLIDEGDRFRWDRYLEIVDILAAQIRITSPTWHGVSSAHLYMWNDDSERTKDDVVTVLRKAADAVHTQEV